MTDRELLKAELENQRRSLAMSPPQTTLSRDEAIALIRRCQQALTDERRIG